MLRPFQYPIWIGIFVSLILVPVCLYVIAKLEYAAIQCSGYWTKLSRSAWYTYGTFLGEGITATLDSEPAWGMRQGPSKCKIQQYLFMFIFSEWLWLFGYGIHS